MRARIRDIANRFHSANRTSDATNDRIFNSMIELNEVISSAPIQNSIKNTVIIANLVSKIMKTEEQFDQNPDVIRFKCIKFEESFISIKLYKMKVYKNVIVPRYGSFGLSVSLSDSEIYPIIIDFTDKIQITGAFKLDIGLKTTSSLIKHYIKRSFSVSKFGAEFVDNLIQLIIQLINSIKIVRDVSRRFDHIHRSIMMAINVINSQYDLMYRKNMPNQRKFDTIFQKVVSMYDQSDYYDDTEEYLFYSKKNYHYFINRHDDDPQQSNEYGILATLKPFIHNQVIVNDFKSFKLNIILETRAKIYIPLTFTLADTGLKVSIEMYDGSTSTFDVKKQLIFKTCLWTYAAYNDMNLSENHHINSNNCPVCNVEFSSFISFMNEMIITLGEFYDNYEEFRRAEEVQTINRIERENAIMRNRENARERAAELERKLNPVPRLGSVMLFENFMTNELGFPFQIITEEKQPSSRFVRGALRQYADEPQPTNSFSIFGEIQSWLNTLLETTVENNPEESEAETVII